MKYKLSLAKDISRLCSSALGYVMLFITVFAIYQNSIPTPYCFFGIPIILISCHIIQHYCYHPILYILLHGTLWIPVCMIPFSHMEYRYLFLFVLLCESFKAIQTWKTSNPAPYEDVPWFLITCTCIFYMIACGYKMELYALGIYSLGIGVLLLHFIRLFIAGLTRLMTKSTQTTSIPVKKIMLSSIFIFIFFAVVLIISSILARHSSVDTAFSALGQLLIRILRFIIRTITYIVTVISVLLSKHSLNAEMEAAEQGLDDAFEELQEPSLLAQILDGCLMIAAMFGVIYLTYRLITALVRIFSKRYVQDTDIVKESEKPKEIAKLPKKKSTIITKLTLHG